MTRRPRAEYSRELPATAYSIGLETRVRLFSAFFLIACVAVLSLASTANATFMPPDRDQYTSRQSYSLWDETYQASCFTFDASGRLWVAHKNGAGAGFAVYESGNTTPTAFYSLGGRYIAGCDFGPDGLLYFTDTYSEEIAAFDPVSETVTGTTGVPGFAAPTDIHLDDAGNIFVTDVDADMFARVEAVTHDVTYSEVASPALTGVAGISLDSSGNVLVGDAVLGGRIARYSPYGQYLDDVDVSALCTGAIRDVAVDMFGTTYAFGDFGADYQFGRIASNGATMGVFPDSAEGVLQLSTTLIIDDQGYAWANSNPSGSAGEIQRYTFVEGTPDVIAPVTSDNATSTWSPGPVTVRLTASDQGMSGLAATYYSLDGSRPSITTTGNVVISSEGTTTLQYFSVDRSGNQEATKTATVRIDNFAPISTATVAPVYYGAVQIDISALDALSGVKEIRWSKDGGLTWNVGSTVEIPPSERGSYTLKWYAVDNAGNAEAPMHEALFAAYNRYEETESDLVYRGSWASTSGAAWSGGAYRRSADSSAAVYVTFTGKVIELYYPTGPDLGKFRVKLDGGSPQDIDLYAATPTSAKVRMTAASVANHVLSVESLNAKNASSTATAVGFDCVDVDGIIVPDTTPPTTTSNAGSGWYGQSSRITLSATDDGFVTQTLYRVGNDDAQTYSGPFAVPGNGMSIPVEFRSIDGPGNSETTKTVYVKADSTPPTTTTDAQTSYIDSATVNFSATDNLSGLDRIQYNLDGAGWTDGDSVQISGYIVHSLQYRAIDVAGNIEAAQSASVRIRRATETYTIYSPELNWYGTWGPMSGAPDASRTANSYTSTYVNGYGRSTNVKVYAYKSNNSGIARVNLDGQITTVDLYAPSSTPSLTLVWDSGTLVDKNHYIAFGCNGTRNASSISARINVHSLAVEGVLGGTVTDFEPPTTTSNIPTSWVAAPFSVGKPNECFQGKLLRYDVYFKN